MPLFIVDFSELSTDFDKQLIFRLDNLHSRIPLSLPAQIILIESLLLQPVSEFEA